MPPVFSKEQALRYGRYMAVAFSLATLPHPVLTLAAQQDEAEDQTRYRLTLIWNDPYQLLQTGFDEITGEVDAVFREFEADIEWKKYASMVFERSESEILVLLLPEKPNDWMPGRPVMGVVSHTGPPVIRIFFDNVTKTLGLKPVPIGPTIRRNAFPL